MKKPQRIMTDHVQKVLGTVDYMLITKMSRVFTLSHIKRCVDRFPQSKLNKMNPKRRSNYLFAICKKHAGSSDYVKTDRVLNADAFGL